MQILIWDPVSLYLIWYIIDIFDLILFDLIFDINIYILNVKDTADSNIVAGS